jgi:hypothetical protein
MQTNTNAGAAIAVGLVAVVAGGGAIYGLSFVLELLANSFSNRNVAGLLLCSPMLLFLSYLIGHGILANRKSVHGK